MIKRSEFTRATNNNDFTAISKRLHVSAKTRYFTDECEASLFAYSLYSLGYSTRTHVWDMELDDSTEAEREALRAEAAKEFEGRDDVPSHVIDFAVNFAGEKTSIWSVTSDAPENVQASLNNEPETLVIQKDFGAPDQEPEYLFMPLDEAEAHYGAYGFYFLNEDGELEAYTEDDFLPAQTTVFTKADNAPDSEATSGQIAEFCGEIAYYLYDGQEICLREGNYSDVTEDWLKQYGVTSVLDLEFVGKLRKIYTTESWMSYWKATTPQGETVLFPRDRSVWIGGDSEWFGEPIENEDQVQLLLTSLED